MIDKIVTGANMLVSKRLAAYGITTAFKYSKDLDADEEWRRFFESVILKGGSSEPGPNNWDSYDNANRVGNNNVMLGLYTREPLRKSSLFNKNQPAMEMTTQLYNENNELTGYQISKVMLGEVNLRFKLVCNSTLMSDTTEILFMSEFASKVFKMNVDFKISEEAETIEDVEYTIEIGEVDMVDNVRETDIRTIEFSMRITGLIFLPFFKRSPVYTGEMELWVFDKSVEPTPENREKGELVIILHPPEDATIKV